MKVLLIKCENNVDLSAFTADSSVTVEKAGNPAIDGKVITYTASLPEPEVVPHAHEVGLPTPP